MKEGIITAIIFGIVALAGFHLLGIKIQDRDKIISSQQLELAKLTGKVEICEEDLAFLDDKNVFVHYDISEDLKRMIGEIKPETKEEVGE